MVGGGSNPFADHTGVFLHMVESSTNL